MFYWKLAAGVIAGLALLFVVGEWQRAHVRSERLADCQAIAGGELARAKGDRCPEAVVQQLAAARSAQACDQALGPLPQDPQRWAAPLSCSRKVQQLAAAQNANLDTIADRDLQLDQLNRGQAAAIARAQARGASQARSYANAQAALDAAPRDPDGLIRCGPDCLRQLAGQDPARGSAGPRHRLEN